MEKYLKFIPLFLLVSLVTKAVVSGVDYPEAIISACILLYIGNKENAIEEAKNAKIKEEHTVALKELKEKFAKVEKETTDLHTYVASAKMSQVMMGNRK